MKATDADRVGFSDTARVVINVTFEDPNKNVPVFIDSKDYD